MIEYQEQKISQPEDVIARLVRLDYKDGEWKMNRYIWENPSQEEADWKVGDLVWPAGEDRNSHFTVKEVKQPGEKYYPKGGVICFTSGMSRSFYLDAIIKHPDGTKKKKNKK